jgi:hypothetical protein
LCVLNDDREGFENMTEKGFDSGKMKEKNAED